MGCTPRLQLLVQHSQWKNTSRQFARLEIEDVKREPEDCEDTTEHHREETAYDLFENYSENQQDWTSEEEDSTTIRRI